MDTIEDLMYDELIDRYIKENAKFHEGQVVYFEYTEKIENQTKISLVVGIVTYVSCTKTTRVIGNKTYIEYPITYTVIHAKGISDNVFECKLGSVTEHILKSRLNRQQTEQHK